jgi:hypothetical protein
MSHDLLSPPHEFTLMPFWFWNDALDEAEILRQIADFEAHGVYGFVIHPRMGLPREIGWRSESLSKEPPVGTCGRFFMTKACTPRDHQRAGGRA